MKHSELLFDTSVYISHATAASAIYPGWLSTVVLQELTVGASGKSDLQKFAAWRASYETQSRLICPDSEAWWQAGKILNAMLGEASRVSYERHRPNLGHEKKQSIIRDVLIAVSAKQVGAIVVSSNKDFPLIQRHYNFRWVSADDYFG